MGCSFGRGAIEIFFGKGLGTPPWGRGAGISGMRSLKIGLAQEREGEKGGSHDYELHVLPY